LTLVGLTITVQLGRRFGPQWQSHSEDRRYRKIQELLPGTEFAGGTSPIVLR
jgi:hypothetical protein